MKVNRNNKGKIYGLITGLVVAIICIFYCYFIPGMLHTYILSLLFIPIGLWIGYTYDRIKYMASYDILTGVANRRALMQVINRHLKHAGRYNSLFSVIFIDVDNFKQINDYYGHEQGDYALKCIASTIANNVRSTDVVGRIGGDEFIVLCPALTKDKCAELAQRIKKAVAQQVLEYPLSISIGISVYPEDGKTTDMLLLKADEIMYYNKSQKSNTLSSFQA